MLKGRGRFLTADEHGWTQMGRDGDFFNHGFHGWAQMKESGLLILIRENL